MNSGLLLRTNLNCVKGGEVEPRTARFQIQRPKPLDHAASTVQSVSRHCISSVKIYSYSCIWLFNTFTIVTINMYFINCKTLYYTLFIYQRSSFFLVSFNVLVRELSARHFFCRGRNRFFCHFQCASSVTFWSSFLLSRQKSLCFSLALICQFLNFWVAIFNVSFLLSKQRLLGSLYLFLENSTSGDSRRNSFPISFMIAMRHLCGILAGKLFSFNFSA